MIRAVVGEGCDAVVILCTNLNGAHIAATLERELDVLILDSVAVTLWQSLRIAGADGGHLAGCGRTREAGFRT